MFYLCFSKTVLKKVLAYLFATIAVLLIPAVACTDYSPRINELQQRLDRLDIECNTLSDNAQHVADLIAALQQNDELVSFEPIAEDGMVVGYKATFKDAGEITLYNQTTNISVAEYQGKYYWTSGGFSLTDAAGNKIEIGNQEAVIDWQHLPGGAIPLIVSVEEDAARVIFTFSGGTTLVVPKYQALSVALEGDDVKVSSGDVFSVLYTITGIAPESEEIRLELLCDDGWTYRIIPSNGTSGRIEITAPDYLTETPVIFMVSDAKGRAVAVQMRLEIDTSENPDPPTPPDPPVSELILVPVTMVINVTNEGGQIEAGLITNADYTVTTDVPWLHWLGTKAVRTDNLIFNVDPNVDAARTATATISSGNYSTAITFRQEGVHYYMHLSDKRFDMSPSAGSAVLYITSNANHTCTCSDDWITIEQTASGSEATYTITVSENATYESRTASVVISSDRLGTRTVEICQRGRYVPSVPHTCTPVCHIMPCCRTNNAGTRFLVNGSWNAAHDYQNINEVRGILQNIKDAGINVISIDFTNASQWDDFGQSALHSGDGGEFWYKFGPMLNNIVQVCAEKDMKYFLFIGGTLSATTSLDYWNFIAGVILERWASDPNYLKYGYGDDRPMLVMFMPGTRLASQLRTAPVSQKNNLQQFHIGTCQVNSPITPTTTDGWGYRNYSGSSDGKVRFACPNSGVPPQDWARVDAAEWQSRVAWALGATEYAVLGSYDDTCDAIFWGIADVRLSLSSYHRNVTTENDPYIYYNIVHDSLR